MDPPPLPILLRLLIWCGFRMHHEYRTAAGAILFPYAGQVLAVSTGAKGERR
jgi:hypothetical protein